MSTLDWIALGFVLLIGVVWWVIRQKEVHYRIYLFGLCLMVIFVVSYFTKPLPSERLVGLTFGSATETHKAITRASWNKWEVINTINYYDYHCMLQIFLVKKHG